MTRGAATVRAAVSRPEMAKARRSTSSATCTARSMCFRKFLNAGEGVRAERDDPRRRRRRQGDPVDRARAAAAAGSARFVGTATTSSTAPSSRAREAHLRSRLLPVAGADRASSRRMEADRRPRRRCFLELMRAAADRVDGACRRATAAAGQAPLYLHARQRRPAGAREPLLDTRPGASTPRARSSGSIDEHEMVSCGWTRTHPVAHVSASRARSSSASIDAHGSAAAASRARVVFNLHAPPIRHAARRGAGARRESDGRAGSARSGARWPPSGAPRSARRPSGLSADARAARSHSRVVRDPADRQDGRPQPRQRLLAPARSTAH